MIFFNCKIVNVMSMTLIVSLQKHRTFNICINATYASTQSDTVIICSWCNGYRPSTWTYKYIYICVCVSELDEENKE